ncbi:class E sortase [Microbacterium sediminicola]|uniref:Class E sortase n=1 Tax=Microbacterium sediminicola TaxID=415210 RepID=A0ABN2IE62_9MICO
MVGVIGELLITVGVVALLYVGWQFWLGDVIIGAERNASGSALSEQWAQEPIATPTPTDEAPDPEPTASEDAAEIPVPAQPQNGVEFAVLRVPRFGADYNFPIAGGVTRWATLDPIGIGHYDSTQLPGEDGNFALAAHRLTHGGAFNNLDYLQIGDAIVVETADGWYTYRFRNLEYVQPTAIDVLDPVPQTPGVEAGEGYITLTTCSPRWTMDERLIAYGVFESFTPRSAGEPASLTEGASI